MSFFAELGFLLYSELPEERESLPQFVSLLSKTVLGTKTGSRSREVWEARYTRLQPSAMHDMTHPQYNWAEAGFGWECVLHLECEMYF